MGNWTQKCLVSWGCLVASMALFCFDFISWGSPSTPIAFSIRALQIFISHLYSAESKGFIARNDLAWRITWAAFSHRRKRPERSGGLSKITGLLRGPLETRTEFCYSCCRGNCTLHFWPFLFHSGAFALTAEEISLDEVFFSFFHPICFICYLFLFDCKIWFQFYLLICVV